MPEGRHAEDLGASKGEKSPPAPTRRQLTDRELDILRYLPTRLSTIEIAGQLGISPNTVKTHLKNIYQKLGARSRQRGHCQGGPTSRDLRRLDGTGDTTRQTFTDARPRISWAGMARPSPDSGDGDRSMAPSGQPNAIERTIRRLDRFQQAHSTLGFPWAVLQKFGNDQATSRAALIAYYGLFAIFPLLLLFTTILGYVLHDNEALRKDLVNGALGNFPIIGTQLQSETHTLQGSGAALVIGAVLLLYGAFGLGQATQAGMNAVWNVPYVRRPNFVVRYARALGVLVLLALSTIGSTVLTGFATLAGHGRAATAILIVGSTLLNFVLIMAAFKVMIAAPLRLREIVLGRRPGGGLLADPAADRKLVRRAQPPAQQRHLRLLRRRHRPPVLDLPGRPALPARRGDQCGPPLPAVAPLHRAAPADRCRSTRIRATDQYGGPEARGPVVHQVHRRGRSGPAQGEGRGIEAGRSVWKRNELTPSG